MVSRRESVWGKYEWIITCSYVNVANMKWVEEDDGGEKAYVYSIL